MRRQIQGPGWTELRGREGAGQSQGLLFWRKEKLLGGRIPKYLEGFVTPHKKHTVHAHFPFLSTASQP